jgi:hypothetical protein
VPKQTVASACPGPTADTRYTNRWNSADVNKIFSLHVHRCERALGTVSDILCPSQLLRLRIPERGVQTSTNRADRHHYGRSIVCIDLVQASPEFRVQAVFRRILHGGQHYEVSETRSEECSCQSISRIAYWQKTDVQKLGGRFGRESCHRTSDCPTPANVEDCIDIRRMSL